MSKRSKPAEFVDIVAEVPVSVPSLSVVVDYVALYEQVGEPKVWEVLGTLKDLFG